MSVRREYSVLVDGVVIFRGSYASANNVYNAVCTFLSEFHEFSDYGFTVSISFSPKVVLKKERSLFDVKENEKSPR